MSAPLSLRAAVVLYRSDPAALRRMLDSLGAAVRAAIADGVVSRVDVRLGDCSPEPVLDAAPTVDGVSTSYDAFGTNLAHSGGVNRLLDSFGEDAALLLNPDLVLAPDAVSELLRCLGTDERIGVVDARQLPFEHPKPYDAVTRATPWASMAAAVVRRATWDEVGPLDEVCFPMHGNDVDFSWRARLAGWRVAHAPAARVFHDKRLTSAGQVAPSEVEEEHGARAALLLAFSYSRPDVVARHFETLEAGTDAQRRGAAGVRELLARGPLPELRDPDHRVAEFVEGNFAVHRF